MSKRYGRNQKRQHRQALAMQQGTIEMQAGRIRALERKVIELQDVIQYTAEVLGENTVALPPKTLDFKGNRPDRYAPYKSFSASIPKVNELISFIVERLEYLESSIEIDELRYQVHFYARVDGHMAGYAVSGSTLRREPEHVLRKMISEALTHSLVEQFRAVRR
jgi:hypothetical protein